MFSILLGFVASVREAFEMFAFDVAEFEAGANPPAWWFAAGWRYRMHQQGAAAGETLGTGEAWRRSALFQVLWSRLAVVPGLCKIRGHVAAGEYYEDTGCCFYCGEFIGGRRTPIRIQGERYLGR